MPPKKRDYANKITDLQPQKSNANKHKEHGERLLRKSVQDYGLADGITVAANNEAISGSLRIETLADVMPDVKIQVVETYGDTLLVNKRMDIPSPDTKQGRALSVASNQVAYTDYNPDGDLLKEWGDEDADIRKLFADSEWRELTGEEISTVDAEPQVDRAAELLEKWKVETGQLWQLGSHRLICGDCTDAAVVARVMGGERADCMWTDPPYGVEYVGRTKNALTIENDSADNLPSLLSASFGNANDVLIAGAPFYVAHPPGALQLVFLNTVSFLGWKIHEQLVWVKDSMVLGHADYHYRHEPILYGWTRGDGRPGRGNHDGSHWYGDNSQTSVFEIDRPKRSEEHPTIKPPELVEKCLRNSTQKDGIVYEPFSRSGTTIIACQNLGRKARAVEISPAYVAVALERFAQAFPNEEIKKLE